MKLSFRLCFPVAGMLILAGCTTLGPEAQTAALIAQAEAAMGSATLKTLTVTGRGTGASVGQAHAPGMPWPALEVRALSRSLNFETAAFREEFIRSRSEALGGGALPAMGSGEARGVVLAREACAWDVVGVATVAAPAALPERLHDLWTSTPQGAVKAAARQSARAGVRRDFLRRWDTLSFELPGQFSDTLVFEDTGLISSIESSVSHALLGQMPVLTRFLDYQPQAGLVLPSRIVQVQGGHAALDLQITHAAADEAVEITVPDDVRAATATGTDGVTVTVDKVADGVWFLAGGTHHSVAIEQAGQIVLVEAPLHAARARAVFDAANKLAAGKQARVVITTHHHFDHVGGLRAAAATEATLYTSALARPYLEAFISPSSVPPSPARAGDAAAPAGLASRFVAVDGRAVLNDAARPIEIHELQGSPHARGLLVVWLPRERLLIQADAYTPGVPGVPGVSGSPEPPPPATPDPNSLNLVQNLERLGLAPRLILPLHGRVVPAADLYAQTGRSAPP